MPVRSLCSSVLKWPSRETVIQALLKWVEKKTRSNRDIVRIGYYGSYARGDWGVGSDLDLVIVIKSSCVDFHQRSSKWDVLEMPVPVDLLVYTEEEFEKTRSQKSKFAKTLEEETVWVYPSEYFLK